MLIKRILNNAKGGHFCSWPFRKTWNLSLLEMILAFFEVYLYVFQVPGSSISHSIFCIFDRIYLFKTLHCLWSEYEWDLISFGEFRTCPGALDLPQRWVYCSISNRHARSCLYHVHCAEDHWVFYRFKLAIIYCSMGDSLNKFTTLESQLPASGQDVKSIVVSRAPNAFFVVPV